MSLSIEEFRNYVVAALDYSESTGDFIWKTRDLPMFVGKTPQDAARLCKTWNTKNAGKPAGRITPYGYREIAIRNKLYFAHRLAWLIVHACWPDGCIDHIDGDRLNNSIANLRSVSIADNQRNIRLRKGTVSGQHGVTYYPTNKRWVARIGVGGKTVAIGSFILMEDAIAARRKAEVEFGYHANHGRRGDMLKTVPALLSTAPAKHEEA